MRNQDFGFARLTVERPMRRVWRVDETTTATLPEDIATLLKPLLGTIVATRVRRAARACPGWP